MFARRRSLVGHVVAISLTAAALSALAPARPALAQGFLDAVFGSIDRAVRRESQLPPRMNSYSDPYGMYERRRERPPAYSAGEPRPVAEHRGPSSGFCVRTCDGLHFPV